MDMAGMGLYQFVGIFSVVLGIVKELLIIFLLFRGIQIANIYLKNNKDDKDDKDDKNDEDEKMSNGEKKEEVQQDTENEIK